MRQSSQAGKAHKRDGETGPSALQSALTRLGATGAILLVVMLWLGRGMISHASTSQILVVGGIIVGGALAFSTIVITALVLPQLSRDSDNLSAALTRVAQGDLSGATQNLAVSGMNEGVADALQKSLTAVRGALGELRTGTREGAAKAQELSVHCSALASNSIKTLEHSANASHFGQELLSVTERARAEGERLALAGTQAGARASAIRARHDEVVQLTKDSIARLDASTELLATLTQRMGANSGELSALAEASSEIRSFVALVRKMARQSKLLALNAAMEAARAGEQGSGFAVVAGEVRRLAHSSSEAAERTDTLVSEVLGRADGVRATSEAAIEAMRGAVETAARGRAALQTLLDGSLGQSPDVSTEGSGDPAALGALVVATLEDALRGARAVLESMREVEGGLHAHRDRAHELATAGSALSRQIAKVAAVAGTWKVEKPGEGMAPDESTAKRPADVGASAPTPSLSPA